MRLFAAVSVLTLTLITLPAFASPTPTFKIAIHDDGFTPKTLTIPAGIKVKLEVTNTRAFPSEFESFQFNREKVVPGNTTVTVWVGPLQPGKYKFFDDFNQSSVGWLVVEKPKGPKK